jgi:transmembrane sensor
MTDHPDSTDSATPSPPDQWDALGRFLAGESSAAEAVDIRQWLKEHPGDAQVVATLDSLLPRNAADVRHADGAKVGGAGSTLQFGRPIDVEAALRRVHSQMAAGDAAPFLTAATAQTSSKAGARGARGASTRRSWTGPLVAAAAAVVAAVGFTQWSGRTSATPSVAQVFQASVGESDTISLADGSRIILASGSKLTVAAGYGDGQRNVELEGAAQFTVQHDEKRPFAVRSGGAVIRDLGTVFTVKTVEGMGVLVAVTEGEVSLSDSSAAGLARPLNLAAGDRGRLAMDGQLVSERGAVTPDEAAWVGGKLVYRDASLAEVQSDLRRWRGVELVVTDSVMQARTITTQLFPGEKAQKLVENLATMWGATVTKRGDTLFVNRSGDRPQH